MKFRDLAHGKVGDMTRVSNTMRAATTRSKNDKDARRALILRYIREHQGQPMTFNTLAEASGYKTASSAHIIVQQLLRDGVIRSHSAAYGSRTYTMTHSEVGSYLPKGDQRNGEVFVTQPEATKTPTKSAEEVFVEALDGFMWEFLKQFDASGAQYQNTALGEVTQALRAFSQFMTTKAIKEKTEHEKGNESRP